jgi:hypothetical protein
MIKIVIFKNLTNIFEIDDFQVMSTLKFRTAEKGLKRRRLQMHKI